MSSHPSFDGNGIEIYKLPEPEAEFKRIVSDCPPHLMPQFIPQEDKRYIDEYGNNIYIYIYIYDRV